MAKPIVIYGEDVLAMNNIRQKLLNAAQGLLEQNFVLFMHDLAKTAADNDDGDGEIPVTLTFTMKSFGTKISIDPAIAWKRVKKEQDSLDLIVVDTKQSLLDLKP